MRPPALSRDGVRRGVRLSLAGWGLQHIMKRSDPRDPPPRVWDASIREGNVAALSSAFWSVLRASVVLAGQQRIRGTAPGRYEDTG